MNRTAPWIEGLALVAVVAAVALGVELRGGIAVRTPDQVVRDAWLGYALWALGIGAMVAGRAVGAWRVGGRSVGAAPLIPAVAAATGLGLVVQLGYGDPIHALGWPGARYADGVALGGVVAGILLGSPIDLGEWIDRGQAAFVAGIVGTFAALASIGSGPEGSDARINLGPIQPLELVKVAFVLFLAGYLGRRATSVRWHRHAVWDDRLRIPRPRLLLPALAMLVVLFGGLFLVRDLGPTLVLSLVFLVVLYLVTRSVGWVGIAVAAVSALTVGVALHPDLVGSARVATRLSMWLHPWLNGLPYGDQLAASRWALAAGGFSG
ncbi:MAG: FtsW/RodA/SpoVE family cell cycle protein, partial [Myxococcota bacterium]